VSNANAPIEIDARLRAALLWDVPSLESADAGAQQWLRALCLDFAHIGELDADDLLSVAAHLVQAVMSGDAGASASHRSMIGERGETGRLLAGMLALWLELDPADIVAQTVDSVSEIIHRIGDPDLRARLLLRIAAFALQYGEQRRARTALDEAVGITDVSTRLGVVARRRAVGEGIEVADFNPYATTHTVDDPLLTLPWIRGQALEASATMAGERLERDLRGVWDTSFHLGRTTLDELLAAQTQADWCGARDLRGVLRKLVSSQILLGNAQSPEQTRWALVAWATSPQAKAVPAAILASEDHLDAAGAATLLTEVHREGVAASRAYVEVAAGVWDLLDDDDAARSLLSTLVGLEGQHGNPQLGNVLANLLWRVPDAWADAFASADEATRAAMLEQLEPYHVDAMPSVLRTKVAAHRQLGGQQTAFDLALAFAKHGDVDPAAPLSGKDALTLLRWRRESLAIPIVEALVDRVQASIGAALEAARENSWGVGDAGTRTLAELATYLPTTPQSVIKSLIDMCQDDHAAAPWQFGALEGLTILRHAGQLGEPDIERVRQLEISPGRGFFGENVSGTLIRAAQLRVYAHRLDNDEVTWLATCARGSDVQSRLVAVAALGEVGNIATATVEWSLVSGLFDPADEVVVRAVAALASRAKSSSDVMAVVRVRVRDLYRSGSRMVRREVVRAARNSRDLEAGDIVASGRNDRAWTVRREVDIQNS
jgi:hypothetical protein